MVRCKNPAKTGVSYALMVILMVVISLAIAGVIASILMGWPGMLATKAEASIEKVDLVATGSSVIVVKNTGNVRITDLAVTVDCEKSGQQNVLNLNVGEGLDPGKTVAETFNLGNNAAPGERCNIILTGKGANDAAIAASASAYVRP